MELLKVSRMPGVGSAPVDPVLVDHGVLGSTGLYGQRWRGPLEQAVTSPKSSSEEGKDAVHWNTVAGVIR